MLGCGDQWSRDFVVDGAPVWFICRFSFLVGALWLLLDGDDGQDRRGDFLRGEAQSYNVPPHSPPRGWLPSVRTGTFQTLDLKMSI